MRGVMVAALVVGAASCADQALPGGGNVDTIRHAGAFTITTKQLDAIHFTDSLQYGSQQVAANVLRYSVGPLRDVILYWPNDTGVWLFDGRTGDNTQVQNAQWPLLGVRWSPDGEYAVLNDQFEGLRVLDVERRALVGPHLLWLKSAQARFAAWKSSQMFEYDVHHIPDPDNHANDWDETLIVTVDPFEIRARDGTLRWPQ